MRRPDTQPFLDKLKREQQEKESGKDNRSFLQKYVKKKIINRTPLLLIDFIFSLSGCTSFPSFSFS